MASPQDLSTLLFSWSPSFAPFSVPITYHVEIMLENYTMTSATNSTSLLFTPHDCSSLEVKVTASNEAGLSAYSANISASKISREFTLIGLRERLQSYTFELCLKWCHLSCFLVKSVSE